LKSRKSGLSELERPESLLFFIRRTLRLYRIVSLVSLLRRTRLSRVGSLVLLLRKKKDQTSKSGLSQLQKDQTKRPTQSGLSQRERPD
jgi:hypothetical protein